MPNWKTKSAMAVNYVVSHLPKPVRDLKSLPVFSSVYTGFKKYFAKNFNGVINQANDAIVIQRGLLKGYQIPRVDTDQPLEIAWSLSFFEAKTRAAINTYVPAGGVVMDVGANRGWLSIQMAMRAGEQGRVYAFEPVPGTVELLNKTMLINNIKNVTVVPLALSDSEGSVEFVFGESGDITGAFKEVGYFGHAPSTREILVPTQTLDVFVQKNNIQRVDMVKIDVEGGEMKVLAGMEKVIEQFKPVITVEFIGDERIQQGEQWLKDRGYTLSYLEQAPCFPKDLPPTKLVNVLAIPKK